MFTGAVTANEGGAWASAEEDWQRLHRNLVEVARCRRLLDAEELELILEAEDTNLHRRLGYVSIHEYLQRELGYGHHAANERLRVARELQDLPQLHTAVQAGELTFAAARELTRVATPETEGAYLAAAAGKTSRQVAQLVAGKVRGDQPETPGDPAKMTRRVWFDLPLAVVAKIERARTALDAEHGERLTDATFIDTVFTRATEPAAVGDKPGRARTQHVVTTCKACRRGWTAGADGAVPMTSVQVDVALCDAVFVGDLDTDDRTRPTPSIPDAIRRKVLIRDHLRCVVPGCHAARYLDVHHLVHREHGGTHAMANLAVLCGAHHRLIHDGRLVVTGKAPDLAFRRVRDDEDQDEAAERAGDAVADDADSVPQGTADRARDTRLRRSATPGRARPPHPR